MRQPTLDDLMNDGRALIPVGAHKNALVKWTQYQTVSPTPAQVGEWNESLNPPVWGGVTGMAHNRVGLDFDGEEGVALMRDLGLTPHRRTPNGGFHVDVEHPGWKVRTVASKSDTELREVAPGLDLKGDGGYINLLGTAKWGPYEWVTEDREPLPAVVLYSFPHELLRLLPPKHEPLPEEVIAVAGDRPTVRRQVTRGQMTRPHEGLANTLLKRGLERVEKGAGRNDSFLWVACQARDNGFMEEEVEMIGAEFVESVIDVDTHCRVDPYTVTEMKATVRSVFSRTPRGPWQGEDGRPKLYVGDTQLSDFADEVEGVLTEANKNDPQYFRRGTEKVRLVRDSDERLHVSYWSKDWLKGELSRQALWYRKEYQDDGKPPKEVAVHPDMHVVSELLVRDMPWLPQLRAVRYAPFLKEDGTICEVSGYDVDSQYWLVVPETLHYPGVSDDPSDDQIEAARRLLLDDLLGEFCFRDPTAQANALGLVLSVVLRSAYSGSTPLAIVTAPTAGSGKTYLASVGEWISTGGGSRQKANPNRNEEEIRKQITASLLAGEEYIIFDNLEGVLRSPTLAGALTAERFSDRILGTSKNIDVPQNVVWAATGNNLTLGGDLPRRCYQIHLDPKMASPWTKEYSRDLRQWAMSHRGELLAACLTLGVAWFRKGQPKPDLRPWGSFTEWQATIGGVLQVAGVDGFLGDLRDFHDNADPDLVPTEGMLRFLAKVSGEEPRTSAELLSFLHRSDAPELPSKLAERLGSAMDDKQRGMRLGKFLGEIKDRRFGIDGIRVIVQKDTHANKNTWRFEVDTITAEVLVS